MRWAGLTDSPVFALTADQDWAPEWAVEALLDEVRSFPVPLHVFRTSSSAAFDNAIGAGEVEQGWHPNFMPGSTQGSTVAEVIQYCERNFPGASTARSHCFAENSFSWRALRAAGIAADSQFCSLCQGYLAPSVHESGIVRLPVYFEDDLFFDLFEDGLNLKAIVPSLFSPGLKILNFHPSFVGCNTPSRSFHESMRSRIFVEPDPSRTARNLLPVWEGRGTRTVFRELISRILDAGYMFHRFHSVAEIAINAASSADDLIPESLKRRLLPP